MCKWYQRHSFSNWITRVYIGGELQYVEGRLMTMQVSRQERQCDKCGYTEFLDNNSVRTELIDITSEVKQLLCAYS